MRLVIDMNLSPAWAEHLAASGHDAVHWSRVGSANAADAEVMDWAARNGHVLSTARARLRVLPLVNRSQSDSSNG